MQENCYNSRNLILNGLKTAATESQRPFFDCYDVEVISNTYMINKKLGKKITTDDLQNSAKRAILRENLIFDTIQEYQDGGFDVAESIDMCGTIAKYLMIERDLVLVEFCSQMQNFSVILKAAEQLYGSSKSSRYLCLTAVLILKYIGSSMNNLNQSISDMNETIVPEALKTDFSVYVEGLQMARQLAAKAVMNADFDDLDACTEVLKWTHTTFYMLKQKPSTLIIDKTIFSGSLATPAHNSIDSVKNVFNLYVNYISKYCLFM